MTIMHMAHDLDAGDIISQAATPIDPDETVVTLHDRLAVLGAQLLVETVAQIDAGTATRTPQDHDKATLAPMLSRELSPMDFTNTAPGTVLAAGKDGLAVACGEGTVLRLEEIQPDGGKRMKAADYLRGHPIEVGTVLSLPEQGK